MANTRISKEVVVQPTVKEMIGMHSGVASPGFLIWRLLEHHRRGWTCIQEYETRQPDTDTHHHINLTPQINSLLFATDSIPR